MLSTSVRSGRLLIVLFTLAGLSGCGSKQQPSGPIPIQAPVPQAEREQPRTEPNTGADRVSAALENSDRVIAGGERPDNWSGFGRGTGSHPAPLDTDEHPSEVTVAKRIHDALLAEPGLGRPLLVTVETTPGRVVIAGSVLNDAERRLAMNVARRAAGSLPVDDHIAVGVKSHGTDR